MGFKVVGKVEAGLAWLKIMSSGCVPGTAPAHANPHENPLQITYKSGIRAEKPCRNGKG